MDRSQGSSNGERNYHIRVNQKGENEIHIPYWEQEGSNSTQYQHLIEENRFYRNKCKHLQNHLEDNHRQFNSLNELYVKIQVSERRLMRENEELRKANQKYLSQLTNYKIHCEELLTQKTLLLKIENDYREKLIRNENREREMQNQIAFLEREVNSLKRKSSTDLKGVQNDKEAKLKAYYNDLVAELQSKWQSSYQEVQREFDKKSRDLKDKIEEIKQLNRTIKGLNEDLEELEVTKSAEVDEGKRSLAKAKATIVELQRQVKQYNAVTEEISIKNDSLQRQIGKLNLRLKEQTVRYGNLQKDYRDILEGSEEISVSLREKEYEINRLNGVIEKLRVKNTSLESDMKKLQEMLSRYQSSGHIKVKREEEIIKELQKNNARLTEEISRLKSLVSEGDEERQHLKSQNSRLKQSNQQLQNIIAELQNDVQRYKKEVSQVQSGRGRGIDEGEDSGEIGNWKQKYDFLVEHAKTFDAELGLRDKKIINLQRELEKFKKSEGQKISEISITKSADHGYCQAQIKRLTETIQFYKNANNKNINTISQLNIKGEEQRLMIDELQAEREESRRRSEQDEHRLQQQRNKTQKLLRDLTRISEERNRFEMLLTEQRSRCNEIASKRKDEFDRESGRQGISRDDIDKIKKIEEKVAQKNILIEELQFKKQSLQSQIEVLKIKIRDSLKQNSERIKKIELRVQQKQDLLHEKQQQIERFRQQINELNRKIKELTKENIEKNKKLEGKIIEKDKNYGVLEGQMEEYEREIQSFKEKVKSFEREIKSKDGELVKKERKIKDLQDSLRQNKVKIQQIQGDLASKQSNREQVLDGLKKQNEKLKKQLKNEQITITRLKQQLTKNSEFSEDDIARQRQSSKQVKEWQQKSKRLREELRRKQQDINELKDEINYLKNKQKEVDLTRQNNKFEKQNQIKIQKLQEELRRKVDQLKNIQSQFQKYKNNTQLQLAQLKRSFNQDDKNKEIKEEDRSRTKRDILDENLSLEQLEMEYNKELQALRRLILYKGYKQGDDSAKKYQQLKFEYEAKMKIFLDDYQAMQKEMINLRQKLALVPRVASSEPIVEQVVKYLPYPCDHIEPNYQYQDFIILKQTLLQLEEQREIFIDKIALWQKKYDDLRYLFESKLQSKDETINLLNLKLSNMELSKGKINCCCAYPFYHH